MNHDTLGPTQNQNENLPPIKHRIFIGLELPPEVQRRVASACRPVLSKVKKGRMTEVSNYHLTVHFIGEVPEVEIDRWKQCVQDAAAISRPFDLTLQDTGFFPKGKKKILWLGSKASAGLEQLHQNVELYALSDEEMIRQKALRERKPFRPHVTLGREVMIDSEAAQQSTRGIQVRVDHLILFESKRISGRLVYQPIAKSRLQE
jgi:2'-5' RNA ligase